MENNQKKDGEVTLIINAQEHVWREKKISFEQVVTLAFGSYSSDPNVLYTVTFSKGPESQHEGSLVKGKEVNVKDRMIFNVTRTDKS